MEKDRHILLILFWGLILEIITFLYFIVRKRFPFEFHLNFILIGITILGIWLVLRKIRL